MAFAWKPPETDHTFVVLFNILIVDRLNNAFNKQNSFKSSLKILI